MTRTEKSTLLNDKILNSEGKKMEKQILKKGLEERINGMEAEKITTKIELDNKENGEPGKPINPEEHDDEISERLKNKKIMENEMEKMMEKMMEKRMERSIEKSSNVLIGLSEVDNPKKSSVEL